jgi:hypothetical protein
LLPFPVADPV